VHALSNIHQMLVPGGALLDLQPIPPSPSLYVGGYRLGTVDQSQVWERFARAEPGVEAAVREGLFRLERELEFDVIERFDSKETLIATINGRDDWHMTGRLAARLEAADPPIDGRDRMRLRLYRARRS
jgi:hypothetical protein